MTLASWDDDARSGDFEPAYDSFYEQSLESWERDYYLRYELLLPDLAPPIPLEHKTAKEWHAQ